MKWNFFLRHFKQSTMGVRAELAAQKFLERHGLLLQEKNFRSNAGEVDLVMLEGSELVFVEVRYRKKRTFGSALESIDRRKQEKIIKAAQSFVVKNNCHCGMRFDIVTFENGNLNSPNWLRNAFSAPW